MTENARDRVENRFERELKPLLDIDRHHNGYDCCGCSTYEAIYDHALRIVREELA